MVKKPRAVAPEDAEARKPDEDPQPAVTGDPPADPPPPAEAEQEEERELVEAVVEGAPAGDGDAAAADVAAADPDAAVVEHGEGDGQEPLPEVGEDPPVNTEAVNDPPAEDLTAQMSRLADEDAPMTGAQRAELTAAVDEILEGAPAGELLLEARHIAALGDAEANRYGLYREPGKGFSTQPGAGDGHTPDTVDQLLRAGLLYAEPSGGRHGSVKITPDGRDAYRRARQRAPAE
jgi:hypothetical protein